MVLFGDRMNSLHSSPALWGEGMVQSANAGLFLTEKELLQLQLHLCAGNGTFPDTSKRENSSQDTSLSLYRQLVDTEQSCTAWQQFNLLSLPFSLFLSSSSCCSSRCFSCSSCLCCSSFLFCSSSCCRFAANSSCCCFYTHTHKHKSY